MDTATFSGVMVASGPVTRALSPGGPSRVFVDSAPAAPDRLAARCSYGLKRLGVTGLLASMIGILKNPAQTPEKSANALKPI